MWTVVLPDDAKSILIPGGFFPLETVTGLMPAIVPDRHLVDALAEVPFSPSLLGRCSRSHLLFPLVTGSRALLFSALSAMKRVSFSAALQDQLLMEQGISGRWCLLAREFLPIFRNVRTYDGQAGELPAGVAIAPIEVVLLALLLHLHHSKRRWLPTGLLVTSTRTRGGDNVFVNVDKGVKGIQVELRTHHSYGPFLPTHGVFPVEVLPRRSVT